MKKILVSGALTALLMPALALAAYNDVSLSNDTTLTVSDITINISGSSEAIIESITVNPATFSFVLQAGSSITITAPNLNKLLADTGGSTSDICNGSASRLAYAATSQMTITITPSDALCVNSGGGGSGGGGGGGGTTTTVETTTTTTASTTAATTTAVVATTTATVATPMVTSLQAQLSALMAQLQALKGGTTMTASVSFSRNLQAGSTGADVKALQVYLNTHGYVVASNGAGSAGNETTRFGAATKAALVKLQKAAGITPASGYFGALTRAYVNAHP